MNHLFPNSFGSGSFIITASFETILSEMGLYCPNNNDHMITLAEGETQYRAMG